ncbi:glycosyltransferase family 4 protein [Pelagibacteraceae bacterium]|nr:glycosyltransferase family 4 protein [Pelagibacteraceae bacterium]
MIIILTQCYPPRIGGIENLIFNLSIYLSKYEKVLVLADQHNFVKETIFDKNYNNNLIIKRFGGLRFFRKRNKYRELKKIIELKKIKAIITDSWKSIEYPVSKINSKDYPIFTLAHGNEVIIKNNSHKKRIINTLSKIDKIICNSKFTENLVHNIDDKLNNTEVIYPGVSNFDLIKPEKIEIKNGRPTLLTLARLEKRKGHEVILNVIKNLKKSYPEIRYIIAGEGNNLANLKFISKKLEIDKNVIFLGPVNEKQKKYIFTITDILVMPTIDKSLEFSIEGFGIAYIEAGLFSIPSIASNVGGTNEAVLHKQTGIIVENINGLEKEIFDLLDNKNERIKLGNNAKNRVTNELLWSNQIKKYISLLSKYTTL